MRGAKPLFVSAPEYKKLWVINPVLIRLKKEQKIRLDSENTGFRWVTPEEMKNYDLVPSVYEALLLLAKAPGEFPLINNRSMQVNRNWGKIPPSVIRGPDKPDQITRQDFYIF